MAQTGRPVCAKNKSASKNSIPDGKIFAGPSKFTIGDKLELGKIVAELKETYDIQCKKKQWDSKRGKWVVSKPKEGYLSKAVRGHFRNLKKLPSSDQKLVNAVQYARRCYDVYTKNARFDAEEPSKKRCRREGGGRKAQAPEFRDSLYQWFIGKL